MILAASTILLTARPFTDISPAHDGPVILDCARKVATGSDGDHLRATEGHSLEVVPHLTGFVTDILGRALRATTAPTAAKRPGSPCCTHTGALWTNRYRCSAHEVTLLLPRAARTPPYVPSTKPVCLQSDGCSLKWDDE